MRPLPKLAGPVLVAGLAAALLVFRPAGPPPAAAQPPAGALPADLALVPADAAGFVHVRLAELWKNEMFAEFRKTFEKAGPKALKALDEQFVPAPSTLDRGTAFVVLDGQKRPHVFGVIAFTAPFKPDLVARTYMPDAETRKAGGKTVYASKRLDFELHFPDTRHVMIGTPGSFEAYLGKPVARDGPMAGAIKLAASGRPVVAAANVAALPIPPDAFDQLPAEVRPLLKAQHVVLSVDLKAQATVELKATYANAAAAADAEKAVRALAELGRKEIGKLKTEMEGRLYDPKHKSPRPPDDLPEAVGTVFMLGAMARADEMLADTGKLVTRTGAELVASVTLPKELAAVVGGTGAVGVGLLLPAVQKVRGAAGRAKSQNNLKQIGLAIHAFHDANGRFPEDIKDKNGKPILSWRVEILPYLEQENIYRLIKRDEPWDSPANKRMAQTAIATFLSPTDTGVVARPDGYGVTNYLGVAGPGTMFDPRGKLKFTDVTDGLSNTIMVIETADPVPWMKPGDFVVDPKKPLPKIAPVWDGQGVNALLGDGSVRFVNTNSVTEKTLRALFTRNGGEVIDPNNW